MGGGRLRGSVSAAGACVEGGCVRRMGGRRWKMQSAVGLGGVPCRDSWRRVSEGRRRGLLHTQLHRTAALLDTVSSTGGAQRAEVRRRDADGEGGSLGGGVGEAVSKASLLLRLRNGHLGVWAGLALGGRGRGCGRSRGYGPGSNRPGLLWGLGRPGRCSGGGHVLAAASLCVGGVWQPGRGRDQTGSLPSLLQKRCVVAAG